MVEASLKNDVLELALKYRKPTVLQRVFDRKTHPSDAMTYDRLEQADWLELDPETIRDCTPNLVFLTPAAWKSIIPALMLASLKWPYLTWEYDGSLITDFIAILTDRNRDVESGLWEALETYSETERDVICNWFDWFSHQHPNFRKADTFARERYLAIRAETANSAQNRIREASH